MLYRTLMHGDGPLLRRERELIAVAVSSANRCHY
jgi:alkylhydroperoxidase family enzyme